MAIAAEVHLLDGTVALADCGDLAVPWWSFTKTVIAAAALALVRDGRLALDAPLSESGPTLRLLLQHRAGLADYGWLPAHHEAVARNEEPWPADEMLRRVEVQGLRPPGAAFSYSNIGTFMVRRLIEDAEGADLGAALQRRVLAPLGVTARLAVTRSDLEAAAMGDAKGYHPGWVYHGLLVGPLVEAARLLDRLLSSDLLPAPLIAEMTAGLPVGAPIAGRPWRSPSYGLGLMIEAGKKGGPHGHTGGGPGSVIAVYRSGRHTGAAFALGADEGAVERAAFAFPPLSS